MKDITSFQWLLAFIASALGIIATIFAIILRKTQIKYHELQMKLILQSKNEFSNLVSRLDVKVSAFINLLFSRISGAKFRSSFDDIGYPANIGFNPIRSRKSEATLFKYRATHYSAEKTLVCKRFLEYIREKIDISSYKKIYLLIDSGSTVFPLFKLLCDNYWDDAYRSFYDKIRIFTNNVPGLSVLIQYGRKGSDVSADMIYKCTVIPGVVEGKYSAILGEEGPTHLSYMLNSIKEKKEKSIVISVVTGNYISLEDGILWRGDYHGQMKSALIDCSDYVFILSPLGKIFKESLDQLNKIIVKSNYPLAAEKYYKSLNDKEAAAPSARDIKTEENRLEYLLPNLLIKEKHIFLITTKRTPSQHYPSELLSYFIDIYSSLQRIFQERYLISDVFSPQTDSDQVVFELNMYRDVKEAYLNYEFPHPEIRSYMRKELFRS